MKYADILKIQQKRKVITEYYRGVRHGITMGYRNRESLKQLRKDISRDEENSLNNYPLPKDGESQYGPITIVCNSDYQSTI